MQSNKISPNLIPTGSEGQFYNGHSADFFVIILYCRDNL